MRQFYTWIESGVVRPWDLSDGETDLAELCQSNNEDREVGLCKSIAETPVSRANLQ